MKEVITTLAPARHEVMRSGETTMVQIVPQIVSSLRLELIFWDNSAGNLNKCDSISTDISLALARRYKEQLNQAQCRLLKANKELDDVKRSLEDILQENKILG